MPDEQAFEFAYKISPAWRPPPGFSGLLVPREGLVRVSPEEERRRALKAVWVEVFLLAAKRQRKELLLNGRRRLLQIFVKELKDGKMPLPNLGTSIFNDTLTPERKWLMQWGEYFHRWRPLYRGRGVKWNRLIKTFADAQSVLFDKGVTDLHVPPIIESDLRHPLCIKDIPHLWEATPRIGGRRRMPRNERIEELKAHKTRHRSIARTLTHEGYRPPPSWGVRTFAKAYQNPDLRSLFHKMCSTNKPIKENPPFRR